MPDADKAIDNWALAETLGQLLRAASELALPKFGKEYRHWTKGKSSPVTEVDIAVDHFLRERLPPLDPQAGWLSEETEDDPVRLERERVFIVDPIDGTRAFIEGRPDWSIVAAQVTNGRPTAAALLVPVTGDLYLAAAGHGTTLNGRRLQLAPFPPADPVANGPRHAIEALARAMPVRSTPRVRSLALRIAQVASNETDVALAMPNGCDWDLAAADLLVHEAGGALTTHDGLPLIYNRPRPVHGGLVAAANALHPRLIDIIKRRPREFV